jgi:hypothetical protein
MIRRGTNYGPSLPPGVLEDDGADRGLMFAFVGAHLTGSSSSSSPVGQRRQVHRRARRAGPADRPYRTAASSPSRTVRSAAASGVLPDFVVNRGGEYCFMPACARCAGSPISTPELRRFVVADHFSGPRALLRPRVRHHRRVHLSSPERPGHLVLVLDVFPSAAPPRCSPTRCATGSASGR